MFDPSLRNRLLAIIAALSASLASAQGFPQRPVTIIAPAGAGGPVDIVARIIAKQLAADWGKPVIVENRPGAGGAIGATLVANAAPDGYTLMVSHSAPLVLTPHLVKTAYNPEKDLVPITPIAWTPAVLAVNANSGISSVKDLVQKAKESPGKFTVSTPGAGTLPQIAAALLSHLANIDLTIINYGSAPKADFALQSAEVTVSFQGTSAAQIQSATGKTRVLAISSRERFRLMPEVPTMIEAGVPGFDVRGWFAITAPAATPKEVVQVIHRSVVKAVNSADVRSQLNTASLEPTSSTPEAFAASNRAESKRWSELVRSAGIKLE